MTDLTTGYIVDLRLQVELGGILSVHDSLLLLAEVERLRFADVMTPVTLQKWFCKKCFRTANSLINDTLCPFCSADLTTSAVAI